MIGDPNSIIDVLVIGGGPAGTTTATMLARKGFQVLLIEREPFPRDHIGESLLPASIPILEELEVSDSITKAGFLPKWGATMIWGKENVPWSWRFEETSPKYPHSYQVWRPLFDQLLLQNSQRNGVTIWEGCNVVDVLLEGREAKEVLYRTNEGNIGRLLTRFIVDASGQTGVLNRKLKLRRVDPFFQNLAVYCYFEGAQRLPSPDETNIFIESYQNGWLWNIPLHTGLTSVGAVADTHAAQAEILKHGSNGFLTNQISQAPYMSALLANATPYSDSVVVKDWSYTSDHFAGDGYVLVGDAACFVDPLFSSGVHLALMSGVMAAAYVTTALKSPDMRGPASEVYEELYVREYEHFHALAKLFYSSNRTSESYFWEARRLVEGDPDYTPRQAFINAVAGQPPRGYERVVLERGELPKNFVASVQATESQRMKRHAIFQTAKAGNTNLYHSVPYLAWDVKVEWKPVIAEGEFVWSQVITNSVHQQGIPCSPLVATMLSLIDGKTAIKTLGFQLSATYGKGDSTTLMTNVIKTIEILYIDGIIAELKGP